MSAALLTPETLLARLRALGVNLAVEEDRLQCDAPAGVLTPDILQVMREHKAALLTALRPTGANPAAAPDAPALVDWFRRALAAGELPREPFSLAPGYRVHNPAGFYAALEECIAGGAGSPWVDALPEDLALLWDAASHGQYTE